jgi:hypothetical protein
VALFEAWAQYDLNSNWSARFGRQVLSYDNQRIMGEIDWAQQGQSHDALLVSYRAENQQLDLGLALNSDKENLVASTTAYTTTYKSMQYAWYHTQMGKINTSLLFLNTGYEYTETNLDLAVDYKQTFGTYLSYKENKWDTNLGLYGQTGKSSGSNVSAWYAGINLGYALSTPLKATLGYEFLSGKSQDDGSGYVKSFTPIFGTNHGFNGFMDYFYVSNHQNNVGLHDVFLKLNYTHNKWQLAVTPHVFSAAATVLDDNSAKMDSYLGTELDFNFAYAVQKDITASAGYSQMFASNTIERVKGITDSASTNNWAWVMISINPRIFTFK